MAPLADDIAELEPRAVMAAAPRFCTCGTKVVSSPVRSVMTSGAGLPLIRALVKSGYCVLEGLPQMVTLVTSSQPTPAFLARAARARLWSSRVIAVQRSTGIPRPLLTAPRQLVLHGLPTTRMRTSEPAFFATA